MVLKGGSKQNLFRRKLIKASATALAALAGCSSIDNSSTDGQDEVNSSHTPTHLISDSPTPSLEVPEFTETKNTNIQINWSRKLKERIISDHVVILNIDSNDIKVNNLKILLCNNSDCSNTRVISIDSEQVKLPASQLFTGSQIAKIQFIDPRTGEQRTTGNIQISKKTPVNFRLDAKIQSESDSNNNGSSRYSNVDVFSINKIPEYSTGYTFDDFMYDSGRMRNLFYKLNKKSAFAEKIQN